jgi:hypothetical protein
MVIPKRIPPLIPKLCCHVVHCRRFEMRVPLSGRRQCAFHRSFGIAFIGSTLVCRERATLSIPSGVLAIADEVIE